MRIQVQSPSGVDSARRASRRVAEGLGFNADDIERVALATAELATNLVRYADAGEIVIDVFTDQTRGAAVQIESRDAGPGIADLERALEEGFSTSGGLGAGLASVRRLMDEFTVTSGPSGTRILARKWPTSKQR